MSEATETIVALLRDAGIKASDFAEEAYFTICRRI